MSHYLQTAQGLKKDTMGLGNGLRVVGVGGGDLVWS